MASDFPVIMQLAGRRCVVVGAGPVGLRKARSLCAASAEVVLVDPQLDPETCPAGISPVVRPFRAADLDGAVLVFAATDSAEDVHGVPTAHNRGVWRIGRTSISFI